MKISLSRLIAVILFFVVLALILPQSWSAWVQDNRGLIIVVLLAISVVKILYPKIAAIPPTDNLFLFVIGTMVFMEEHATFSKTTGTGEPTTRMALLMTLAFLACALAVKAISFIRKGSYDGSCEHCDNKEGER